MTTTQTDRERIRTLIDGTLPWGELRDDVVADPKDPTRFADAREIRQARVEFDAPILVPSNDHLYATGDDGRRVTAACRHDLGALGDNWRSTVGSASGRPPRRCGSAIPRGRVAPPTGRSSSASGSVPGASRSSMWTSSRSRSPSSRTSTRSTRRGWRRRRPTGTHRD